MRVDDTVIGVKILSGSRAGCRSLGDRILNLRYRPFCGPPDFCGGGGGVSLSSKESSTKQQQSGTAGYRQSVRLVVLRDFVMSLFFVVVDVFEALLCSLSGQFPYCSGG